MKTLPCDKVVLSGITHPFGWLSQSPGYVSDSLLSRSPLCIATPCDLHVLATPPAFRLSQDQTLQLNFLARVVPDARCDPCGLTEADTFTTVFILEMSLSIPVGLRLIQPAVTAPSPAKASGSAGSTRPKVLLPAGLLHRMQGSNIFDGLLKQNDQGRSLTCVHHENA